jgi:REP element-mobilizing transposase RayT
MPRCARLTGPEVTYHVMVRSISEVTLFKDVYDKERYLKTMKKYQEIFKFKVYAYCLMGNHAHFIIYSNGADISKIMHGVNQSYAQYYNKVHLRHGHLFQDRFKSKIVDNDRYLIALSAYIHNNPCGMQEYSSIEDYPYSSLGVYLGKREDPFNLVDPAFVLKLFSGRQGSARLKYREYLGLCTDIKGLPEYEFENDITEYISGKYLLARDADVDEIKGYISGKMGIKQVSLTMKYCSRVTAARAVLVLFLRTFCDMKYREICRVVGGITVSRASKLCSMGHDAVEKDERYRQIMKEFMDKYKAA